jgi:hypothetical protein
MLVMKTTPVIGNQNAVDGRPKNYLTEAEIERFHDAPVLSAPEPRMCDTESMRRSTALLIYPSKRHPIAREGDRRYHPHGAVGLPLRIKKTSDMANTSSPTGQTIRASSSAKKEISGTRIGCGRSAMKSAK